MEKIRIHNSYGDWDWSDKVNMHRLKLKWESRFLWSNIFWVGATTFILTKNWVITTIVIFLALPLLFHSINDHEFYDDKVAPTP